jgi:uncharacterized membrane protein
MMAGRLRAAFVAACAAWAVLIVAAPFLASRAHASPLANGLIFGVYAIGSLVCHQLPERSSQLWGAQMPVCARCAGIYVGAFLGAVAALALRASVRRSRLILGLAVTPTLVTLVYEWTTGDMPSHAIRAAAGVPIGLAVAWLVVAAADNQVN